MGSFERAVERADPIVNQVVEHRRGRPAIKVEVSSDDGMIITFADDSTLSFPELTCGSHSKLKNDTEIAASIVIIAARMVRVKIVGAYSRLEDTLTTVSRMIITRDPESGELNTITVE